MCVSGIIDGWLSFSSTQLSSCPDITLGLFLQWRLTAIGVTTKITNRTLWFDGRDVQFILRIIIWQG